MSVPNADFSPGPWHLGERKKYHVEIDAPMDRFPWSGLAEVVVRMEGDRHDYPLGLANAYLIAAAPEIYEALLLVSRNSGKLSHMEWQMVEDALAKARGDASAIEAQRAETVEQGSVADESAASEAGDAR